MGDQLVTFENAKRLEILKFKGETGLGERDKVWYHRRDGKLYSWSYFGAFENMITAPTQSSAQKWFREVHNIHINPTPYIESLGVKEITGYYVGNIIDGKDVEHCFDNHDNFPTYELALEFGISEALTWLEDEIN